MPHALAALSGRSLTLFGPFASASAAERHAANVRRVYGRPGLVLVVAPLLPIRDVADALGQKEK